MEYRERREPDLSSIKEAMRIESLAERLEFILAQDDKVGALARHLIYNSLAYAARCISEITNQFINADRAVRWGFAHRMGSFEMWDVLGVRQTVEVMEARGIEVAS